MGRMNYNRPQFRIQGRQVIDIREEKQKQKQKKQQQQKKQHKRLRADFDIAAMIENDVREIATNIFFNTLESKQAEVDRRLAGIEHTRRVMAALVVKP